MTDMNDSTPNDLTQDLQSNFADDSTAERCPQRIGRYRIERVLGKGGFGIVYLAQDEQLGRSVAVKVPHAKLITKPEDAEMYLAEARTVANLDHPSIVPVHDVGSTVECPCFIVLKYIQGTDLATKIKHKRLPYRAAAELVATVADALHYAHKQGLVHRDVKPGNILIADDDKPYVVDFGLALRDEHISKWSKYAGTPAYMSPEQARGEGHRVDGRSDIFSLGVVFYELLAGRQPFRGDTQAELLEQVTSYEARPLRQFDEKLPKELERICHKAMAKRAGERYSSAYDMAEDLRHFLTEQTVIDSGLSPGAVRSTAPSIHTSQLDSTSEHSTAVSSIPARVNSSDSQPIKVVPKGLRSFDAHDADFFLELLPGPRDREGLPDSLRFWKVRIEETDPDVTFSVGLIYGPSGCGKSSLMKAGLLPRLSDDVISVYIEATPEETENRLLYGLRKRFPSLDSNLSLKNTLAALRRGQYIPVGRKVLIVLDQFEQWLHATKDKENTDLVQALRQCDGGRVQCVVMVRDDFWLAVSRFLRELEVRLVEGENSALADLFDLDHARKVLAAFGRAFGKLPQDGSATSDDQKDFVQQSVTGLAVDGKVICVRLSLFAEMMKGKSWTPATLKEVGGTTGVGVTFLEETFSASTAPPECRYHQEAARAILKALLPNAGTNIKGEMKSRDELLAASGYANRPKDFDDLIRILDSEIRLITPTDSEVRDARNEPATQPQPDQKYYQLTHDYLVHSLREWLTHKQKETHKGRAELMLVERSALWRSKPENRFLPSLTEWLRIQFLTESKHWTVPQRAMMRRANQVHGLNMALATGLLLALVFTGIGINRSVNDRQDKLVAQKQTEQNQAEAIRLVEGLLNAETVQVNNSISTLNEFRVWANPDLQKAFNDSPAGSNAKLNAALALVTDVQEVHPDAMEFLKQRLLTVTPAQLSPVRELLKPHKAELTPDFWQLSRDGQQPVSHRFRAACVLAAFDSANPSWEDPEYVVMVAQQLVTVSPVYIGEFKEMLRPVAQQLVPALSDIFTVKGQGELAKSLATALLTDYASQDPNTLTELVLAADVLSDKSLFPVLQQHQPTAVKNLEAVIDQRLEIDWNDAPFDSTWTQPSSAVRAQIESAHGLITERFAFCQDMPMATFLSVAETLRPSGYRPTRVRPSAQTVAAIWTRDNFRWRLDPSLKESDIPGQDAPATIDGMWLTDIAVIPASNEFAETLFIALWSESAFANEQRRVLLDVNEDTLTAAQTSLNQQEFISQRTIFVRTDTTGQRRYTGIWSNQGAPSELRPAYAGFELIKAPFWDMAVANAITPQNPEPLSQPEVTAAYAALWHADVEFESKLIPAMSPNLVIDQLKPLLNNGWRPFAIAMRAEIDKPNPLCSLVLHRPLIPDSKKDALALRQAAAAAALLRLNATENVWPLFQYQTDPRLCSYLLHRLADYGIDPQSLFIQLQQESKESSQQPLILGLGEFARAKLLSTELRAAVIGDLAKRYADDPSPGIHGAAEWTLKQLGAEASVAEVRAAYSTGSAVGDRRWYLTKTGSKSPARSGMQFAIIAADEEFLMGSPVAEVERFQGPTSRNEVLHRRRLGRRYAIGTHEVTVAQFRAFRSTHKFERSFAREENAPANLITWFDAAAFCNWLSKEEGIPPEQWCYDPAKPVAEGLLPVADYLKRTGYRLLSESEWEYACRAGTTTARYYGEDPTLLGEYACYNKTSGSNWMLPVGTLRPNRFGLFDMLGNALEWCQDASSYYDTNVDSMSDEEQKGQRIYSNNRVLRGGSLFYNASFVRAAKRDELQRDISHDHNSFRVGRTLPPVP